MPNKASQLRFTIVATKDPQSGQVKFFVAYVHLFGFKLAVSNFYRFPAMMTALCRRLGAVMVWHFFDDFMTLQLACERNSGQAFLDELFALCGWPVDSDKHKDSSTNQVALGVHHDLQFMASDWVRLAPREERLTELKAACK